MQIVHSYVGAVLVLLYTGVAFRRNRKIHVPIMITSFIFDLGQFGLRSIPYLGINF